MSPWNVRVSIIEPGSFKTGLMEGNRAERIFRGHWESLSEEIREDYSEEYVERRKIVLKIGRITMSNIIFNHMHRN